MDIIILLKIFIVILSFLIAWWLSGKILHRPESEVVDLESPNDVDPLDTIDWSGFERFRLRQEK